MNRILSFLLVFVMLIPLLVACNINSWDNSTKIEEGNQSQATRKGPFLVINGIDISEFKILKEYAEFDEVYQAVENSIFAFCGERLEVTEKTDSQCLIRIVEDFSLLPNEYCICVSEGELRLGVFCSNFVDAVGMAQDLLSERLTGDALLEWENGYCEKGSFEQKATPYSSIKRIGSISLYGGTDKDPLTYVDKTSSIVKEEDRITFRLACIAGDQLVSVPWIKYEFYDEATGRKESGYLDASTGMASFTHKTVGRAGAVYFNATACDQSKQPIKSLFATANDDSFHYRGSAVVNREKVTMSAKVPDDFDCFWQSQVEALYREQIQILKMTPEASSQSGFKLFYLELRCNVYSGETDGIVSGYLTYPEDASTASQIDLRVGYKGYGFLPAEPQYYANAATFSVCAHSIDCERAKSDSAYLDQQEAKDTIYNDNANSNRETVYFRGMILRDLQATRFMVEYFGEKGIGNGKGKGLWNGKNFIAEGGSQGAFQAIAVAALDKNITYLEISRPWMCDIKCANNRKQGAFMTYKAALEYYDTTSFAHLITCKTDVAVSLGDATAPVSGILSFYNALTCEKAMICSQNASHLTKLQTGVTRIYN